MAKSLNKSLDPLGSAIPRYQATRIESILIAAHATQDTERKPLTPIARDSSTGDAVVYEQGGANNRDKIIGFTVTDTWTQLNADPVHTGVMVEGEVEYADIEKLGVSDALFKADLLASGLRQNGIHVKGLDKFYS